jgi:hypothetical protein
MHMLDRRRRLAARFLAVGLLAATLFAVDSLSSPSPAEARCGGPNNPIRSTYSPFGDGVVRATETAFVDTCNGNDTYQGVLEDTRADGYCVSVQFANGDFVWYEAASVCGVGNTNWFSFTDSNHNSRLYEQLCVFNIAYEECGWGEFFEAYGLNWGF